jgi:hypothetical protein
MIRVGERAIASVPARWRRGKVLNDDRAEWRQAFALFPGDVAYVWHEALHGDVVAADLAACGLQLSAQIVWVKQHFTLSRGHYHALDLNHPASA